MHMKSLLFLFGLLLPLVLHANEWNELKVKRKDVFEFVVPPSATRNGDRVEVSFTCKDACDVTVAVEDEAGRIVRHLASGVLGDNAPPPFAKNSLAQTVVWDGKDDQERYVEEKDRLTIRVSLGLKPRFERNLIWSPQNRLSDFVPIMVAAPEGMYVYDGYGVDHLRLFDHKGEYVRTVYPYPAEQLNAVKGLNWVDFLEGPKLPFKFSKNQQTLLNGGDNSETNGMGGRAATAMAVHGKRIALAHLRLNRLTTDGNTGGLELQGPEVKRAYSPRGMNADGKERAAGPSSAAFSPDGKWVYLAGYGWRVGWSWDYLHGVARIPYEGDGNLEVFAGSLEQDKSGAGEKQFNGATSVACDALGRVYVTDYINDRIQVFNPDGALLKSIPVARPAQLEIHPKTQELYVFSWTVFTRGLLNAKAALKPALVRLGAFDDPREKSRFELPVVAYRGRHEEWWEMPTVAYRGALDFRTEPPTVWLASGKAHGSEQIPWDHFQLRLFREKDGKLEVVRAFGPEAGAKLGRQKAPIWNIQHQRLYVNPKTGKVYMGEPDCGPANKAFQELVEMDPATGALAIVKLPFSTEDVAFDTDGLIYMRSTDAVGRFDPASGWREIPFDYGEELDGVSCEGKSAKLAGGIGLPSQPPVCFHQGGMWVNAKGHLAISCANYKPQAFNFKIEPHVHRSAPYQPQVYPGRMRWGEVHVWDRKGKIVQKDVLQGLNQIDGVAIDSNDNIFVLTTSARVYGGKTHFNSLTGTLLKAKIGQARILSSTPNAPVPLSESAKPKRPPDIAHGMLGQGWIEGTEWLYGGVGFSGFNNYPPGSCACWHARFSLDFFGRSFVPEVDRYDVAVLDTAGNLILRIGRYGNADDGVPLVKENGAPGARSLGGDETSFFHAGFLATHSDRRLFVADIGNARTVSVKLEYHREHRTALKDVPDQKAQ